MSKIDVEEVAKQYKSIVKKTKHAKTQYNNKTEVLLHVDIFFHENNTKIPIFIAVDAYTRLIFLKVLEKKSENVTSFLDEIFKTLDPFGNRQIKTIIADEGTEWNSLKKYKKATLKYSNSVYGAYLAESHISRIRRLYSYYLSIAELEMVISGKRNKYNKKTKENIIQVYENIEEVLNARVISNRGYSANEIFRVYDAYNKVIEFNKTAAKPKRIPKLIAPDDYTTKPEDKEVEQRFYVGEIVLIADKEKRNPYLVKGRTFTKKSAQLNFGMFPGEIVGYKLVGDKYLYQVGSPFKNETYVYDFYANELRTLNPKYTKEYLKKFKKQI